MYRYGDDHGSNCGESKRQPSDCPADHPQHEPLGRSKCPLAHYVAGGSICQTETYTANQRHYRYVRHTAAYRVHLALCQVEKTKN